jgi:uncharacterized protein YgiM (DUF1202 family)
MLGCLRFALPNLAGLSLVLMLLLAPPILALPGATAEAREMLSVARPGINMRNGPGTRYDAKWSLAQGYPVEVLGRKGKWVRIRDFERDTGWIYRPLLAKQPHHIVKVGTANIRSGPGTRYRLVGKAIYGDVLRTLEKRKGWVKVRTDGGLSGWISRRLLWGW